MDALGTDALSGLERKVVLKRVLEEELREELGDLGMSICRRRRRLVKNDVLDWTRSAVERRVSVLMRWGWV